MSSVPQMGQGAIITCLTTYINALSFQCNGFQLPSQYSCENIPTTDSKSHVAFYKSF